MTALHNHYRNSRLKAVIFGTAIAFIVLAVVYLGVRSGHGEVRHVRLSNGDEHRICAVSYGRSHQFIDGPAWKQLAARVLPAAVLTNLNVRPFKAQTSNDVLMVWVESPLTNNYRMLSVIGTHGYESAPIPLNGTITRGDGKCVTRYELRNFPRRQPFLRLRLRENTGPNKYTPVAEFVIRNRNTVTVPPFVEQEGTHTSRDEDFEATLETLSTGLTKTGILTNMYLNDIFSEVVFRIGTNQPAQLGTNPVQRGQWTLSRVTLNDATGNEISTGRDHVPGRISHHTAKLAYFRSDDGVTFLKDVAWPDEPWKVRAEFTYSVGAQYPSNLLWSLTDLPVPEPDQTLTLQNSAVVAGAKVSLISFTRRNKNNPNLTIRFEPPDNRYELRFDKGTDQDGKVFFGNRQRGTARPLSVFDLRIPPTARRVNLTFAVTRTYVTEHVITPRVTATNLAHWPLILSGQ